MEYSPPSGALTPSLPKVGEMSPTTTSTLHKRPTVASGTISRNYQQRHLAAALQCLGDTDAPNCRPRAESAPIREDCGRAAVEAA